MVRRSDRGLPLAAMEALMRKAGAERVADSAKVALKQALEDIGKEIAAKAVTFSRHAGRRTVMRDDVKLSKITQDL